MLYSSRNVCEMQYKPGCQIIMEITFYGSTDHTHKIIIYFTSRPCQLLVISGEVPPRGMNQHCRTGDRDCTMCTNQHKNPVYGLPCGHYYCTSCISCYVRKLDACPKCRQEKQFRGNQPIGYMDWRNESRKSLPGYEKCGTIVITFNFPAGIQGNVDL